MMMNGIIFPFGNLSTAYRPRSRGASAGRVVRPAGDPLPVRRYVPRRNSPPRTSGGPTFSRRLQENSPPGAGSVRRRFGAGQSVPANLHNTTRLTPAATVPHVVGDTAGGSRNGPGVLRWQGSLMRWFPFTFAVAVALVLAAAGIAGATAARAGRTGRRADRRVRRGSGGARHVPAGRTGRPGARDRARGRARDAVSRPARAICSGGERGLLGLALPPTRRLRPVLRELHQSRRAQGDRAVLAAQRRSARRGPGVAVRPFWPGGRRSSAAVRQSQWRPPRLRPRRFLYVGTGDGGGGNDPGIGPRSQRRCSARCCGSTSPFPTTTRGLPRAGRQPVPDRRGVLPEIWAFGYRNPWRFAFDDVGDRRDRGDGDRRCRQNQREEIDYEPAGAAGRNYGWRLREGTVATPGVPVAGRR